MPSLDTNVLVRWLVEDDRKQTARVQTLFDSARDGQFVLFVPSTVALELEWVLRSRYQFEKSSVLAAFIALLEAREIEFQDEAALERALDQFRLGVAEFADCLHVQLAERAAASIRDIAGLWIDLANLGIPDSPQFEQALPERAKAPAQFDLRPAAQFAAGAHAQGFELGGRDLAHPMQLADRQLSDERVDFAWTDHV